MLTNPNAIAAAQMAAAIIKNRETIGTDLMNHAARGILVAASTFALAACANAPSARSYSAHTFGDIQPGALRLFIDTALDENNTMMLVSGSASGNRRQKQEDYSEVLFKSESEEVTLVVLVAPDAVTSGEKSRSVAEWANRFQHALIELSAQIHGPSRPAVSLSVMVARPGAAIDRIHMTPLRKTEIDVQFEIPAALAFNENSRPGMSNLIAHEIYHALAYSEDADRMSILKQESLQPLERALGEAAAMLFGQCASLKATGSAMQDENIIINDRPGGVLADVELNEALAGGLDELSEHDFVFIGKAIGNTIWASRVSSKKLISRNELAEKSLLALCTPITIGEPMALVPLLREIASDGVGAPSLE